MPKKSKRAIGIVVLTIILFISAIPKILNYQGKLVDSSGVGINDTLSIIFRLYSGETGEIPLWVDTVLNVPIINGLFSVELSGFPDSVNFFSQYWLEVEIEGEVISPREKLSASPYSLAAHRVERALQSISTDTNPSKRIGNLVLRGRDGVELGDDGDSIVIIFSGGTGSELVTAPPLTGEGTSAEPLSINYDNTTIGISTDNRLFVKDDGITSRQLANLPEFFPLEFYGKCISVGSIGAGATVNLDFFTVPSGKNFFLFFYNAAQMRSGEFRFSNGSYDLTHTLSGQWIATSPILFDENEIVRVIWKNTSSYTDEQNHTQCIYGLLINKEGSVNYYTPKSLTIKRWVYSLTSPGGWNTSSRYDVYNVPAGKKLYVNCWLAGLGGNETVRIYEYDGSTETNVGGCLCYPNSGTLFYKNSFHAVIDGGKTFSFRLASGQYSTCSGRIFFIGYEIEP